MGLDSIYVNSSSVHAFVTHVFSYAICVRHHFAGGVQMNMVTPLHQLSSHVLWRVCVCVCVRVFVILALETLLKHCFSSAPSIHKRTLKQGARSPLCVLEFMC